MAKLVKLFALVYSDFQTSIATTKQGACSQTLPFKRTASFRQNDSANKRGVGAHSSAHTQLFFPLSDLISLG